MKKDVLLQRHGCGWRFSYGDSLPSKSSLGKISGGTPLQVDRGVKNPCNTLSRVKWSGPFSPKFWPSESCLVYLSAIRITWCGWVPSPQWLAWPDSAEETARDRTDGGNARPPPRGKQKWWMGKRLQGKCGRRAGIVIFFLAKKRPKGSYEFFFDDLHWELKTMQFSPQTFGFHEKYC